jgi:hypothetical protein
MNNFEFFVTSLIITLNIIGICDIIQDFIMSRWTVGFNLNYEEDQEFEAIIRHCNPNLKLKDQKVFLSMGSDCVYHEGAKMSWNWNIVMHRPVKKKGKIK